MLNKRNRRIRAGLLVILAATILGTGCDRKPAAQPATKDTAAAPLTIYTTFYPTAYFAERIAGDLATVVSPCPPDADPAFWTPDEQTIAEYQKADLILVSVPSFEKWVTSVSLPPSRVVVTTKPFEDDLIMIDHAVFHSHGPSGEHSHEGVDGHTWLDPVNAKIQAGEILKALIKLHPEHKTAFEKGYAALSKDLDELDARLRNITEDIVYETILCSHPAYNYLGQRYGWTLVNFDFDPGEMPNKEQLAEVHEHVVEDGARCILWESEPTEEIAAAMTEMGLTNVVYSPCEALDAKDKEAGVDYLSVMTANVDRFAAGSRQPTDESP